MSVGRDPYPRSKIKGETQRAHQTADDGVGAGLRQMMEQSRQQDVEQSGAADVAEPATPQPQETSFDFFTVLPEIEVVVPDSPDPTPPKPKKEADDDTASNDGSEEAESQVKVEDASVQTTSAYMLQAGSYKSQQDADKLKAQLALMGHSSTIQKVTIQGQGDFYRVRLGPFVSHDAMARADEKLASAGIKSLRLKVSRGG